MEYKQIPVVLLAGGTGMRLHELTEWMPKALVPIGNIPVVLHVMKIYAHYGFKKFIFCLGYKGDLIRDYFLKCDNVDGDLKLIFGKKKKIITSSTILNDFEISFVDTGLHTPTGGRIKKIEKYIDTDNFFCTYSDSLADINVSDLLNFHLKKDKVATLTAVHPMSPFGIIEIEDGDIVTTFKEKPFLPGIINGGFFVFNKKIFNYLDENIVLEEEPLKKLAQEKLLVAYQHNGFWTCMDTYKDYERLNKLWEENIMPHTGFKGKPPWKVWE